ncbi:MAG: hypothetical protein FJX42_03835, partial [Alphaproteobacteria bacterium]|nr:hypothetical protein [Alphaproteobacteria bacterium]
MRSICDAPASLLICASGMHKPHRAFFRCFGCSPCLRPAAPQSRLRSGQDSANSRRHKVETQHILKKSEGVFGVIYLISLADIFAALGGHSSRVSEAVHLICKRAIERHVGGDEDVVEVERADVYAFRIPGMSPADAWAKAVVVADEVGINILGERYVRSAAKPMIRVAVANEEAIRGDNGFDGDKIEKSMEMVRGKSYAEIFRDWQEFLADKSRQPNKEWAEFRNTARKFGFEDLL